jgi:hypothetical protein
MADSFSDVTGQSWLSRLFGSIGSVLFGVLMFAASFILLYWNEGRAVTTARSLEEGGAVVVSAAADTVDPSNEGKLVHVTGTATTSETLKDPDFGVSAPAIHLARRVQLYQWQEEKTSRTRSKLGGGTETVTDYEYKKTWNASRIDSAAFKHPEGHENPPTPSVATADWTATSATIGAYALPASLEAMMRQADSLPVDANAVTTVADTMKTRTKAADGGFFVGADPASPAIGDAKVTYEVVRPSTVSLIAKQTGSSFEGYPTKAGRDVLLLKYGTVSAADMFSAAEASNSTLTWVLRGVGYLLMALGIMLVFRPLVVVAEVVPFIGSLLGGGIAVVSFAVAAGLSLVTIAVSWIRFRPVIGGSLLVAAVAVLAWVHSRRRTPAPAPSKA